MASLKSNVLIVTTDGKAMGSSMVEYTTWRVVLERLRRAERRERDGVNPTIEAREGKRAEHQKN